MYYQIYREDREVQGSRWDYTDREHPREVPEMWSATGFRAVRGNGTAVSYLSFLVGVDEFVQDLLERIANAYRPENGFPDLRIVQSTRCNNPKVEILGKGGVGITLEFYRSWRMERELREEVGEGVAFVSCSVWPKGVPLNASIGDENHMDYERNPYICFQTLSRLEQEIHFLMDPLFRTLSERERTKVEARERKKAERKAKKSLETRKAKGAARLGMLVEESGEDAHIGDSTPGRKLLLDPGFVANLKGRA